MKGKALVTGLCGLLLLSPSAFAESPVTSTEKVYRLLQLTTAQLAKTQKALGPQSPAPVVTALGHAQEQVRIASAHCCRALYTAHLEAAKAALTQHEQAQALHHLQAADKTLENCAAPLPGEELQKDQDALALGGASE
ncbi:MAG: hypothetical protein HY267_07345 [Deltaproteobacteria bacterium]|nr:hypothetical protein [Deltaproteobacteria bacterium]